MKKEEEKRESLRQHLNNTHTIIGQVAKFGHCKFNPDERTININPTDMLTKPLYMLSANEPISHDEVSTLLINVTINNQPITIENPHLWFPVDFRKHNCKQGDIVMVTGRIEMYQYNYSRPIIKNSTLYNFKIEAYNISKL